MINIIEYYDLTEKEGFYLESRFMKVFKEDIFTLRALHSNMILRIPQKVKNSLPTCFFEKDFFINNFYPYYQEILRILDNGEIQTHNQKSQIFGKID